MRLPPTSAIQCDDYQGPEILSSIRQPSNVVYSLPAEDDGIANMVGNVLADSIMADTRSGNLSQVILVWRAG